MHAHSDDPELQAALAAARQPLGNRRMPSVGLRLRIKTSPALRRLLPTPLALWRATTQAAASWESSPSERRRALGAMAAAVAGTPREPELEELARQYLIEDAACRVLFWQPWKRASMDVGSRERLEEAVAQRRGVLLSACHMGPIFLYISAISYGPTPVYIVSAPWFLEEPGHDEWGRRLARWWQGLQPRNERMIYRPGASRVMRALLGQGEMVLNYFDMPGSRPTRFLGKTVMLASSTARVAADSDALVLPIRARRDGQRAWTDIGQAHDPRRFASAEELHDALAVAHERSILELPATLEDPTRPGSWAAAAGATDAMPSDSEVAPSPPPDVGRSGGLPV